MSLWTFEEIQNAIQAEPQTPGQARGDILGVSIDSRKINAGDLFVALRGENFDGAKFVDDALAAGAVGAITESYSGNSDKVFVVKDALAALRDLAAAARARSKAKIIGVTGSVGKTSTKEMLAHVMAAAGRTHATIGNLNNHFGLPLTLARMPRDTEFAVLEMGMNHANEIAPLSELARPDIAIITTVDAVHLEHFPNVSAIADAKAEIFAGMAPGGIAILNRDNHYYPNLFEHAQNHNLQVQSFGQSGACDAQLLNLQIIGRESHVRAKIRGEEITYMINAPGAHWAVNSLAVLLAATAAGMDLKTAAAQLATITPPSGRGAQQKITLPGGGEITVLDESYNASPISVAASLATLGQMPGRKIAVLGDMRELGTDAAEFHRQLAGKVIENNVDLLFCCGSLMRELFDQSPPSMRGEWAADSALLAAALPEHLQNGDVVLVKGSNGMKMNVILARLEKLNAL